MGMVADTNGTFSARENVPLSYGSGNVWEWVWIPPFGRNDIGGGRNDGGGGRWRGVGEVD